MTTRTPRRYCRCSSQRPTRSSGGVQTHRHRRWRLLIDRQYRGDSVHYSHPRSRRMCLSTTTSVRLDPGSRNRSYSSGRSFSDCRDDSWFVTDITKVLARPVQTEVERRPSHLQPANRGRQHGEYRSRATAPSGENFAPSATNMESTASWTASKSRTRNCSPVTGECSVPSSRSAAELRDVEHAPADELADDGQPIRDRAVARAQGVVEFIGYLAGGEQVADIDVRRTSLPFERSDEIPPRTETRRCPSCPRAIRSADSRRRQRCAFSPRC